MPCAGEEPITSFFPRIGSSRARKGAQSWVPKRARQDDKEPMAPPSAKRARAQAPPPRSTPSRVATSAGQRSSPTLKSNQSRINSFLKASSTVTCSALDISAAKLDIAYSSLVSIPSSSSSFSTNTPTKGNRSDRLYSIGRTSKQVDRLEAPILSVIPSATLRPTKSSPNRLVGNSINALTEPCRLEHEVSTPGSGSMPQLFDQFPSLTMAEPFGHPDSQNFIPSSQSQDLDLTYCLSQHRAEMSSASTLTPDHRLKDATWTCEEHELVDSSQTQPLLTESDDPILLEEAIPSSQNHSETELDVSVPLPTLDDDLQRFSELKEDRSLVCLPIDTNSNTRNHPSGCTSRPKSVRSGVSLCGKVSFAAENDGNDPMTEDESQNESIEGNRSMASQFSADESQYTLQIWDDTLGDSGNSESLPDVAKDFMNMFEDIQDQNGD